jgi:acetolactate decarboxylase
MDAMLMIKNNRGRNVKKIVLIFLAAALLLGGCAAKGASRETIAQGAAMEALLAGNYDAVATVGDIKKKGDTGLGTFTALDGEMIVLDGVVYKAASNGEVTAQPDGEGSPFYAVTFFDEDITQSVEEQNLDYDRLKAMIDTMRPRDDLPYAIRIPCTLASVQVRSVGPCGEPYPPLSDAVAAQTVFDYSDINGTLVGYWFPDYLGNTNAAGYHLHFISDDRTKGGHVLDLRLTQAEVELDETQNFDLAFSPYDTKPLSTETSYQ